MPERTGEELVGVFGAAYGALLAPHPERVHAGYQAVYDLGRADGVSVGVDAGLDPWAFPMGPAAELEDRAAALTELGELLATDSRMVPAFSWTFPEVSRDTREDVARPARGLVRPWRVPVHARAWAVHDCDWLWDCLALDCGEVGVSRTAHDANTAVRMHLEHQHPVVGEPPC